MIWCQFGTTKAFLFVFPTITAVTEAAMYYNCIVVRHMTASLIEAPFFILFHLQLTQRDTILRSFLDRRSNDFNLPIWGALGRVSVWKSHHIGLDLFHDWCGNIAFSIFIHFCNCRFVFDCDYSVSVRGLLLYGATIICEDWPDWAFGELSSVERSAMLTIIKLVFDFY